MLLGRWSTCSRWSTIRPRWSSEWSRRAAEKRIGFDFADFFFLVCRQLERGKDCRIVERRCSFQLQGDLFQSKLLIRGKDSLDFGIIGAGDLQHLLAPL